jgi:hypothetical protein
MFFLDKVEVYFQVWVRYERGKTKSLECRDSGPERQRMTLGIYTGGVQFMKGFECMAWTLTSLTGESRRVQSRG